MAEDTPQATILDAASTKTALPKSLSVRQKISIGFGGLIFLMTISIGITLIKLTDVADTTQSVIEERQPTANLFQRMDQNLNLATTLLHGYLMTNESELREEFEIVALDIKDALAASYHLKAVHDGNISHEQLENAEQLFEQFLSYSNQLYNLHDNKTNNRGLLLVEKRIQPIDTQFLDIINTLLTAITADRSNPNQFKAYSKLHDLRYAWVQMTSNLRLFLATQRADNPTDFGTFNIQADKLLTDLKIKSLNIDPSALKKLTHLHKEYIKQLQPMFDEVILDEWRADAYLIKTEVGPISEKLRRIFENIADEQLGAARESGKILTEANQQIQLSTITILIVAVLLGALLAIRITRDIVPPIQRLMVAARAVAHGDLNTEVKVTSSDEIGQLGLSFNAMIDDLREAAIKEQNILDELENRVQDRTKDLEKSEIKIRAILENIGEGIIVLDEKGTIESLNPAAENIFKMKEEDAIGLNSTLLVNGNVDNFVASSHYNDKSDDAFNNGGNQQPKEFQGLRSDGSTFPLEFVVSGMTIDNKPMRVCILRDVTARKETEKSLADAQHQLVDAAHKSGMADMATGVLHNIGNILNSVNLSVDEVHRIASSSKISGLLKANDLLLQHHENMTTFLTEDGRGQKLPDYFIKMGKVLSSENAQINQESSELIKKVTMMKEVINTQQSYAKSGFYSEQLDLPELIEDALKIQESSLRKWGVKLLTNYAEIPSCMGQKSKLLQVITNLVKNAKEAMDDNDRHNRPKELTIETGTLNDTSIYLKISDNGCGIGPEQLTKIFNHGFTTKETGHGFGLHTCANAMTEMKGALKVDSKGVQKGACFTVIVPIGKAA